eukprot:CAMPEP_0204491050 /NCGR_PEP_ID=MMETSP0471-20130131/76231_1 /ASSEMBLY_ACC=CAM_ASM_000602 /TAXON_ID=2969 /ORGANISM="Oxyrrhis marina" /LENGTH=41 /DNA_ID= /DNA_START= /DNA_END= /DNA_ORIENTATION=
MKVTSDTGFWAEGTTLLTASARGRAANCSQMSSLLSVPTGL